MRNLHLAAIAVLLAQAATPAGAQDNGRATRLAWTWPWQNSETPAPSSGRTPTETKPQAPSNSTANPAAKSAARETAEVSNTLDAIKTLQSACANAAWTLWASNQYPSWRNGRTPVLVLNYSIRTFEQLPPVSAAFGADLQQRLSQAMTNANTIIKDSFPVFKEMSNYVNAKDYEGDKFKKGDALNERLVAFGKSCHAASNDLHTVYVDAVKVAIDRLLPNATQADAARTMLADWQQARGLADELAKGRAADINKLTELTTAISALADKRRAEFAADIGKSGSPQARFYDSDLNEDAAVKMRKMLRDIKANPAAFKDAADDRPRTDFRVVRDTIDLQLPSEIFTLLRK
ncbi:hypothetical protein [Bradyrhizobium prioriisuperbiae]|uniref:hypothetical protein n=1 Tax=Bradyrhizobium prioriisuperbiae TaxID=2854389 RepID=UPI0028E3812B|nr:hypothetical protein [Bradyrhizobium prioritasuperba]